MLLSTQFSMLIIVVDLDCRKCYKKIRKILCELQCKNTHTHTQKALQPRQYNRSVHLYEQQWTPCMTTISLVILFVQTMRGSRRSPSTTGARRSPSWGRSTRSGSPASSAARAARWSGTSTSSTPTAAARSLLHKMARTRSRRGGPRRRHRRRLRHRRLRLRHRHRPRRRRRQQWRSRRVQRCWWGHAGARAARPATRAATRGAGAAAAAGCTAWPFGRYRRRAATGIAGRSATTTHRRHVASCDCDPMVACRMHALELSVLLYEMGMISWLCVRDL